MTPLSKSASSPADLRGTNLYRVAIVGAATLKGKEVAEVLRERNFPAVDVRLLDDDIRAAHRRASPVDRL